VTGSAPLRLLVRTSEIDPSGDLVQHADPHRPLVWLRRGEGMVGAGEVARLDVNASAHEPRALALSRAWAQLCADATVEDAVAFTATGFETVEPFTGEVMVTPLVWAVPTVT